MLYKLWRGSRFSACLLKCWILRAGIRTHIVHLLGEYPKPIALNTFHCNLGSNISQNMRNYQRHITHVSTRKKPHTTQAILLHHSKCLLLANFRPRKYKSRIIWLSKASSWAIPISSAVLRPSLVAYSYKPLLSTATESCMLHWIKSSWFIIKPCRISKHVVPNNLTYVGNLKLQKLQLLAEGGQMNTCIGKASTTSSEKP